MDDKLYLVKNSRSVFTRLYDIMKESYPKDLVPGFVPDFIAWSGQCVMIWEKIDWYTKGDDAEI